MAMIPSVVKMTKNDVMMIFQMYDAGAVDSFHPDYKAYPLFKNADCYLDTVKEGMYILKAQLVVLVLFTTIIDFFFFFSIAIFFFFLVQGK